MWPEEEAGGERGSGTRWAVRATYLARVSREEDGAGLKEKGGSLPTMEGHPEAVRPVML